MALEFRKLFAPAQLGLTAAAIYTLSTTPTTLVLKNARVRLTNTAAAAVAVTLYAVPSGGSASATNTFLSAKSIAAGASLEVDVPTLSAGDAIHGFASAATSINIQEAGGVLYS